MHEVGECGAVGGRRAAKSPHKTSCLPFEYELFGIDVGQRSNPEGGFADELGEDTSGAERDERAEHGILDKAREELRPSRDHRLHEDGTADPLYSGANLSFVLQIESYAPCLGLVCARCGGLHNERVANGFGSGDRLVRRRRDVFRDERDPVGEEELARVGGLEPAFARVAERALDDGNRPFTIDPP